MPDITTSKSYYIDGSGLEHDLAPIDYAGAGSGVNITNIETAGLPQDGIYELGEYLPSLVQNPVGYSSWSSWIEKYQMDYRFIAISDMNAEAYLFPNVDDPWMFTEYIFQGKETSEKIVEPELFDESLVQTNITEVKVVNPNGWSEDGEYPTPNDGVKLYRTDIKVQSVFWGEHGNIPPKVLNMTAPKSWIDSTEGAGVQRIVPVITSSIGFPNYADSTTLPGKVTEITGAGTMYINGIEQPKPKIVRNEASRGAGQSMAVYAGTDYVVGNIVHEGCEFWNNKYATPNPDGNGYCSNYTDLVDPVERAKLIINYTNCTKKNGNTACPYWRQKSLPVEISTWTVTAANEDEWARVYAGAENYGGRGSGDSWKYPREASNVATLPLGGGSLFYGAASMGVFPLNSTNFEAPRTFGDHNVRTKITYELRTLAAETKEVYNLKGKNYTRDDAGKYIRVKRNTGILALDEVGKSDVYEGVDPVYYTGIEQTSFHRWLTNIMHCQDCRYCNSIYGYGMTQGFDPLSRMKSPSGVPTGTPFCRYYIDVSVSEVGGGCPWNSVPKMAYEFQQISVNAAARVFPYAMAYCPYKNSEGLKTLRPKGYYGDSDVQAVDYNGHYLLISDFDKSSIMGGIYCGKDLMGGKAICHFTIDETIDPPIGSPYTLKDVYVYIYMYTDSGVPAKLDGGLEVPWLVKLDKDMVTTKSFCIHISNEDKFMGGTRPEYKDISRRKAEILENVAAGTVTQGDYGVGDPDYWGQKEAGFYEGYYPDKWGEWILDGRSIGPYPPTGDLKSWHSRDARSAIVPGNDGGATPIAGIPLNTLITPELTLNARILAANVFTNDTVAVLEAIKDEEYGDDDGWAAEKAPPQYNANLIPTSRTCPHCTVDDLYFHEKFSGLKCTWCGTTLVDAHPPLKLPIVKAIGKTQVYAMPGMTIKGDAYFWKSPTVVNEALVRQMTFKLGKKSTTSGGYSDTNSNNQTETNLARYKDGIGYYKFPETFDDLPITETEKQTAKDTGLWNGMSLTDLKQYVMYNALIEEDPLAGQPFDETFFDSKVNDKFIMPYSDPENKGGLHMITITQLKKLRNTIQPVLGYVVGEMLNPDFDTKKTLFEKRRHPDARRTWTLKPGRMGIEVLAATTTGMSNFHQYWTGDIFGTVVREYMPTGAEWWRKNNRIGAIGRSGGISQVHCDGDGAPIEGSAYPYTGSLRAKALVPLYGVLPLDKEVLKAYAILEPTADPEIGNPPTFWSGRTVYNHYHAFWTGHETWGRHDSLEGPMWGSVEGNKEHSSDEGDLYPTYKKKKYSLPKMQFGTDKMIEEQYDSAAGFGGIYVYSNETLAEPLVYSSAIVWQTDKCFTNFSRGDESNKYGHYSLYAHDDPYGYLKGTNGTNWTFSNDIVQVKTEYELWKHYTFEEFEQIMDNHSADVSITAESHKRLIKSDFRQYSQVALQYILPEQMQAIPGMFDLAGLNSVQKYPVKLKIAEKVYDTTWSHDGKIIVQSVTPTDLENGPVKGSTSGGRENRVIDITDAVLDVYNDRVSRRYEAEAGQSIKEFFAQELPVSECSIVEESEVFDALLWNYRYKEV